MEEMGKGVVSASGRETYFVERKQNTKERNLNISFHFTHNLEDSSMALFFWNHDVCETLF